MFKRGTVQVLFCSAVRGLRKSWKWSKRTMHALLSTCSVAFCSFPSWLEGSTPHHCWSVEWGLLLPWCLNYLRGRASMDINGNQWTSNGFKRGLHNRMRSRNSEKLSPALTRMEMVFSRRTLSGRSVFACLCYGAADNLRLENSLGRCIRLQGVLKCSVWICLMPGMQS